MERTHPPPSPVPARGPRTGFALIEALVVMVACFVVFALLTAAASDARRQARLGDDIAKLRQFGVWTGSYAADNQDLFWSFSWRKGYSKSQWPDLNAQAQGSDLSAGAAQGVDILRRLAGRTDILPINGWVPHVGYSHLPLSEYVGAPLPNLAGISAADEYRLMCARDPHGFDAGLYSPNPPLPGSNGPKRWPYSASFSIGAGFFDGSPIGARIHQVGLSHNQFWVPNASVMVLGGRQQSEVAFPAVKVFMQDTHARHFGVRQPYCTHDQARLPLLFTDGGVTVRSASESNPGWQPNHPTIFVPTNLVYTPEFWEPPTMSGAAAEIVFGRFRWTRGCPANLLAGRDFDGPEVCTPLP
ncbi:MAG: type II secretion system protein [Phycisphaerales bacterium]